MLDGHFAFKSYLCCYFLNSVSSAHSIKNDELNKFRIRIKIIIQLFLNADKNSLLYSIFCFLHLNQLSTFFFNINKILFYHNELRYMRKLMIVAKLLMEWAELSNLYLVVNTKKRGAFHSAAWGRDYNSELCFVMIRRHRPLAIKWKVDKNFAHSQCRPVIMDVELLLNTFLDQDGIFKKQNATNIAKMLTILFHIYRIITIDLEKPLFT